MQELAALRSQLTGTVNVEVDAAPQQDLNRVLEDIRAQYEAITDKHRRDQETWFNEKVKNKPKRSQCFAINTAGAQSPNPLC